MLTIQWTYEESRPSTFMSTRCCWRAGITKISSVFISYKYAHCLCGQGVEIKVHRHKKTCIYYLPTHELAYITEERVMTASISLLQTVYFLILTHETSFSDADVFFTFLQQKTFR